MLSSFSFTLFLAIRIAVLRPPNLVEAESFISPFSEIALSSCFSNFIKLCIPLAYSASVGAISFSPCKKVFICLMAASVLPTSSNDSASKTVPSCALFIKSEISPAPPKGNLLPISSNRSASSVSVRARCTNPNSPAL